MILKILVLAAAIAQVAAPAFLSIGTFETTERILPVFIQPASFAFAIWGLIYTLSIIYAVYQLIPKYENATLKATRLPALLGFLGSIAWLFFAGMNSGFVWLTIPTLFAIAISYTFVVNALKQDDVWKNTLSKNVLLPYAAWTGIASWINIPTVMLERGIVESYTTNYVLNLTLFAAIATFTLYYYRKSGFSAWYGGVLIWASVGVVFANSATQGSIIFALLAGLFILVTIALYVISVKKEKRSID